MCATGLLSAGWPWRRGADESSDDFAVRAADLAAAIRLGYEVERNDPNTGFEPRPDNEIEWLAAWLISEGWGRTP